MYKRVKGKYIKVEQGKPKDKKQDENGARQDEPGGSGGQTQ